MPGWFVLLGRLALRASCRENDKANNHRIRRIEQFQCHARTLVAGNFDCNSNQTYRERLYESRRSLTGKLARYMVVPCIASNVGVSL
jgi:hypothetical protein